MKRQIAGGGASQHGGANLLPQIDKCQEGPTICLPIGYRFLPICQPPHDACLFSPGLVIQYYFVTLWASGPLGLCRLSTLNSANPPKISRNRKPTQIPSALCIPIAPPSSRNCCLEIASRSFTRWHSSPPLSLPPSLSFSLRLSGRLLYKNAFGPSVHCVTAKRCVHKSTYLPDT